MRITKYDMQMDHDKKLILVKENATNYPSAENLTNPNLIYKMMCDVFHANKLPEEHVWLLAFSAKMAPIGIFEISHGGGMFSYIDPKAIFSRLLLTSAAGFVLVHNHPSGDPEQSQEDLKITKALQQGAALMGMQFFDHIIVGDARFLSLRNEALME